jgi:DNA-binding MarR family transcriptional regulator
MTTRKIVDITEVTQDVFAAVSPKKETDRAAATISQQIPATRYDLRLLQALRQIIRAVDLHSRRLLRQHQITGPQLICLLTIDEYEPVTANAIAGHIHLSPSTVIGILDRLETKGLIRRERDRKDRRLVHITLTEQGKSLACNAPSPLQDALVAAMDKLSETELTVITESLERIAGLMQMGHADAAPILETGPIDSVLEDTNL